MKRTTVMVDENDLQLVKEAAKRTGRTEAELIREAFHLVAASTRTWADSFFPGDLVADFGGPVREHDITQAVEKAITNTSTTEAESAERRDRDHDMTVLPI